MKLLILTDYQMNIHKNFLIIIINNMSLIKKGLSLETQYKKIKERGFKRNPKKERIKVNL